MMGHLTEQNRFRENLMVDEYYLQFNAVSEFDPPQYGIDLNELPTIVGAAYRGHGKKEDSHSIDPPACIRLDLEDLKCFEIVERQFQQWGVTFANAIALQPSNPAFPPHSGKIVLIGAPKSGFLEATFIKPVRFVSGFITSSRRAVLAAYDSDDQAIAHAELPSSNLAGSDSEISPNTHLSLTAPNIHRVTFFTFDGHLTLDDFSFSF